MTDAVRQWKTKWPWLLVLGTLGIAYGPSLAAHIRRGLNPLVLNDDARQQIYPFFRYADSALFPSDYIGDYYLDCLPIGFRALYMLSAGLIDPVTTSKVVMYGMLLITVAGVGVAARRLAGRAAAWGAMALILGASLYLDRMGGGLPRAFGFPIIAWALAALSYGRVRWLAILVWLGACFYPVAGVVVGITTALVLMLPAADRGDAAEWSPRRRALFLAVVTGVSVVLLLPTIVTASKYAPTLTADDIGAYPEAGPGGRYGPESRAPYGSFLDRAALSARRGLIGAGRPWVPAFHAWSTRDSRMAFWSIGAFTVIGWLFLIVTSSAARRVALLGAAAFLGYTFARAVAPFLYLPTRYSDYAAPLLAVLSIATAAGGYLSVLRKRRGLADDDRGFRSLREGASLAFCLVVLLGVGGRGSAKAGLNVEIRRPELYEAIAELPADAVVAGWPRTAIENVPYISRRTALLTYETHQAFHRQYADVMRTRMRAVIDAAFATTEEPLRRLRDEQGVTHLLVYLPEIRGHHLRYFKPFDAWIDDARREAAGQPRALERLVEEHPVYRDGRYVLVDLTALSGPT